MKKVSIIKGIFIILLSVMLIGATTTVFAVDVDEEEDEDTVDTLIMDDEDVNSTPAQKTTITPTNNTTIDNTSNVANNNTPVNNTSASVYNNTVNTPNSLSKAGLEDSIPTMALIVLFGISAVYAYKKIKDYKNI